MQINEQYYSVQDEKIFVKVIGEGTPIIFLHGGPGAEHRTFLPHIQPLADDFKLILYDQRGCGKSQKSTDNEYRVSQEVETLEGLRKALNIEKVNLVGESWGTMLALAYAANYPENVNKIVLSSAVGLTGEGLKAFGESLSKLVTPEDKLEIERLEKKVEKNECSVNKILEVLNPYYMYDRTKLSKVTEITNSNDVNSAMCQDIVNHYDLTSNVDTLQHVPILLMQAENDILPPEKIKPLLLNDLQHVKLQTIKNCGHWIFVEQPNQFNENIKEFITGDGS